MADDRRVGLGCGTLILIALIVLIFSQHQDNGSARLTNDLKSVESYVIQVRNDVNQLQQLVRDQSERLSRIEAKVDKLASAKE
jgi:hypothetical protein